MESVVHLQGTIGFQSVNACAIVLLPIRNLVPSQKRRSGYLATTKTPAIIGSQDMISKSSQANGRDQMIMIQTLVDLEAWSNSIH